MRGYEIEQERRLREPWQEIEEPGEGSLRSSPEADDVSMPEEHGGPPSFFRDHRGIGTVEMILILVVLIALVLIFKSQLNSLVETIFKAISKSTKSVIK